MIDSAKLFSWYAKQFESLSRLQYGLAQQENAIYFKIIYLFNFASYIHIHTRIAYNGQMTANTLQLSPITVAL